MKASTLLVTALSIGVFRGAAAAPLKLQPVPPDVVRKFAPEALKMVHDQITAPPLKVDEWQEKALAFYAGAFSCHSSTFRGGAVI